MAKGIGLVKNAMRDFELAKKYTDSKEYTTASILYRKATEKVLKALFMQNRKRSPPNDASIEYLAEQTVLPDSIYNDLVSLQDEPTELMEEELLLEYDEEENTHRAEASEYRETLSKHELVRRLIDYAKANV